MQTSDPLRNEDIYRIGASASVVQAAIFALIGLGAFGVSIERIVMSGLVGVCATAPGFLGLLCCAFIAIALLGLAITPAERQFLAKHALGLSAFGASVAIVGHASTIAFFSWWLVQSVGSCRALPLELANELFPLRWGLAFELGLVGFWVWIIASVWLRHRVRPRGFLFLSVFKAICFWLALPAFLTNRSETIGVGVALTTFIAGPAWHLWIARIFHASMKMSQE